VLSFDESASAENRGSPLSPASVWGIVWGVSTLVCSRRSGGSFGLSPLIATSGELREGGKSDSPRPCQNETALPTANRQQPCSCEARPYESVALLWCSVLSCGDIPHPHLAWLSRIVWSWQAVPRRV
jgi:hypothetical protein